MNITWVGSPNFDTNRKPIDRVVIHWMAGTLASADAQFQKAVPGTSAHYGVENEVIHQYVKEENVAYHAGVYTMNQRSIGIEHSAAPDRPATDATYQTAGQILGEICRRHNIPIDRTHIIKHSEVKATQCPGTMDLDRLIKIAGGSSMLVYKGYDLDNHDSMKVAVDILVRVQAGEFVDKPKYDADVAAAYAKGKAEGVASVPPAPTADWVPNGKTVSVVEGNTTTTTNYAKK